MIAIIMVLAAILFPVFRSVRDRAMEVRCTSNLRQIGLAMQMYCQDNDETLPMGAYSSAGVPGQWDYSWHDALSWDVRSWEPFFCPVATLDDNQYRFSYGVNHFICGYQRSKKLAQITLPANEVFATEKENPDYCFYSWGEFGANEYWRPLVPRHNGKVMVLHVDGHVKPLSPSKLVVAQVQVR